MTEPEQFDQLIRRRLTAYSWEATADVIAPGTHDVYRVVKQRQRRRIAALAAACVAVLIVLLGTVVQLRRNASVPGVVPPSASPSAQPPASTGTASPSSTPSNSPSPPPSPTAHTPTPSTNPPSTPPPTDPGPARRSYPVVDGSELHVVALDRVTLRPVGGHYEGIVYVDVYNSGRQTEEYNNVSITTPPGVQEQPGGPLGIGGCGVAAPPETWVCPAAAVPAAGGYVRSWFTVTVNIAPGGRAQTIPGFAVRFEAYGQQNAVLTDVTPADNKATTTLVLPAG